MTCQWPGNLTVADAVPCGPTNSTFPVVPCCGARDQCMTDNLCRYTRSRIGGSGFYIAGCTASDEGAFDDASGSLANVCVNRCSNKRYPDAIYTPEKSQWSCCGGGKNGSRGCDNPTDWTFPASAPASLVSYGPNLNTKSHASSGLSTGAKAGIGVGVGVGGLIIIAAVVFGVLFLRRRKRNTAAAMHQEGGMVEDTKKEYPAGPVHKNQAYPAELAQDGPVVQELPAGHRSVPQELPAGHGHDIQELPGDNNWAK